MERPVDLIFKVVDGNDDVPMLRTLPTLTFLLIYPWCSAVLNDKK
jgi:hypothetical protein